MNPSAITIERTALDKIQSTVGTLLLIGTVSGAEIHVMHAVGCAEGTLGDVIADARESLPLGVSVLGLGAPKTREQAATQLVTKFALKLYVSRGDDLASLTATFGGKRLAISGDTGAQQESAVITWFRPPSCLEPEQIQALVKAVHLVDRGSGAFTVAAPPLRGVQYSRHPFILRAFGVKSPADVEACWKADVCERGIAPWIWVDAKPFCARFRDDGSTAGEIVVAMRDMFGVRVRTKDVKFPAAVDDEPETPLPVADASQSPMKRQQELPSVARTQRFDNRTLLIVVLVIVFIASVTAVLMS
jgi:hypothetical protein